MSHFTAIPELEFHGGIFSCTGSNPNKAEKLEAESLQPFTA